MKKRLTIIGLVVLFAVIVVSGSVIFQRKNVDTFSGYVMSVDASTNRILICYNEENLTAEGYLGDCYVTLDSKTKLEGVSQVSEIQQGDVVQVGYEGSIAEIMPSEIVGTVRYVKVTH